MTLERFSELWNEILPERQEPAGANLIVMEGSAPHLVDALIKYANGDHSVFDDLDDKGT